MLPKLGKTFEANIAPDIVHYISSADNAVKIPLPAILFLKRVMGACGDGEVDQPVHGVRNVNAGAGGP